MSRIREWSLSETVALPDEKSVLFDGGGDLEHAALLKMFAEKCFREDVPLFHSKSIECDAGFHMLPSHRTQFRELLQPVLERLEVVRHDIPTEVTGGVFGVANTLRGIFFSSNHVIDVMDSCSTTIGTFEVNMTTNDFTALRLLEPLIAWFKQNQVVNKPAAPRTRGYVYCLVSSSQGVEFKVIGGITAPFQSKNYSLAVTQDIQHVLRDVLATKPTGRLALFQGVPGVGKTSALESIIYEARLQELTAIFVPAHETENVSSPDFLKALMDMGNGRKLIVLEDADLAVSKRKKNAASDTKAIASLLNLTDGILGKALDLFFVVTTNAELEEIDPAIRRPGRLSRLVHIGTLSADEAQECFYTHTGSDKSYDSCKTLAEVYADIRAYNESVGIGVVPVDDLDIDDLDTES